MPEKNTTPPDIDYKINEVLELFDFTEKHYKESNIILERIDMQIIKDFRYATRNLATLFKDIRHKSKSDEELIESLLTFKHTVKVILNDIVDLQVSFATVQIFNLNNICSFSTCADVCENYGAVKNSIYRIKEQIPSTRENRGKYRTHVYKEILNSNEYRTIIDFLYNSETYFERLKGLAKKELEDKKNTTQIIRQAKYTLISGIVIGVSGLVIAILALIYK